MLGLPDDPKTYLETLAFVLRWRPHQGQNKDILGRLVGLVFSHTAFANTVLKP